MALRAVLFDFGKTLFNSPDGAAVMVEEGIESELAERIWTEIWERALSPEELARGRDRSEEAHERLWKELFSAADPYAPGISARLYDRVMKAVSWVPYTDAAAVLAELDRRGVAVGVLSNTGMSLRPAFARHGLDGYVRVFVESFRLGIEKPDPAIFEVACRELGTPPEMTLMVGDSHLADGAAVRSGLTVLLLPQVPAGAPRGLEAVLGLVGV
ncbi:MAG: HAD family hydrolase [Chloroflexota bacterium]